MRRRDLGERQAKSPSGRAGRVLAKHEKRLDISLCMIVKDEEGFLPGCLDSVKGIANEIVVVDTGSTDRTVEIACQYGAKVYHYEWNDDFAAARNESLKHATCGWILVLDADERLDVGAGEALKAAARGGHPRAIYAARIVNRSTPGGESQHYFPRFFPNHAGIQYVGLIHERPVSDSPEMRSPSGLPYRLPGFTIIHHGYAREVVQARDKMHRNIDLLRKVLGTGDDPYYRYKLGSMLLSAGRTSEAVREIEQVLAALDSMGGDARRKTSVGRVDVLMLLAEAYRREGREADVSAAVERALEILPSSQEARYRKALHLFEHGRVEEARSMFLALASDHRGDGPNTRGEQLLFDIGLDTWKPLTMAARCSVQLGDVFGAVKALAAAAGYVPRNDDYLVVVREVLDEVDGDHVDGAKTASRERGSAQAKASADAEMLRGVLGEEARSRRAQADRLLARGEMTRALELYASSARLDRGSNGDLLAKIAYVQLQLGNTREAFSVYLQALRDLPRDFQSVGLLIELTEAFKGLNSSAGESGSVAAGC